MKKTLFAIAMAAVTLAFAGQSITYKAEMLIGAPALTEQDGAIFLNNSKNYFTNKQSRMAINPEKAYKLSADIKLTGNQTKGTIYFCIDQYDKQGRRLFGRNYNFAKDTDAVLLADIKKGDTKATISYAQGWLNDRIVKRGSMMAFGAAKDHSDLPNFKISPLVKNATMQDEKTLVVEFKAPLLVGYPAGTAVRLHQDTAYFGITVNNREITQEWKHFEIKLDKQQSLQAVEMTETNVWPGTKFLGMALLVFPKKEFPEGTGILIKNATLEELD